MSTFPMKTYHYACNDCGAFCEATVVKGTFDYEDTGWVCAKCIEVRRAVWEMMWKAGLIGVEDDFNDEEEQ